VINFVPILHFCKNFVGVDECFVLHSMLWRFLSGLWRSKETTELLNICPYCYPRISCFQEILSGVVKLRSTVTLHSVIRFESSGGSHRRTEAVYWNSIIKKIKASAPTQGSANMLRVLPTIKRINWPHAGVTSWPRVIVHNELLYQHISNLWSRFHCRPQHTATKTFQAIGEY
jgi:hypothetical protein